MALVMIVAVLWWYIIGYWLGRYRSRARRSLFRLPWAYTKPPTWNPLDWRRWNKRTAYELTWAGEAQPAVGDLMRIDSIMRVKVLATKPGILVVIQVR